MPSHKTVKTYEKRTRLQINSSTKSVDAINALFAQNLTKRLKSRRRAKLKLKELPPRIETYLTDDSLKVEPNNTFDKVLKGKVYNKVKVGNFVKIISSDSEASKPQISVSFHSPIMTRRRKKSNVTLTELSDKKTEKSSTLDKPVTSSYLSIEKENNKAVSASSLSYIKLPKITEDEVPDKLFSDTFRERQAIHSSTPYVAATKDKIVADPISPITKSDSSRSSKLMEKSYDQIRQWDEMFPRLEVAEAETPKRKSGMEIKTRRRKLSAATNHGDWKLLCEPKVHIRASDIISKKLELDFHGFSQEEQSSSSEGLSRQQFWLKSLPKVDSPSGEVVSNLTLNSALPLKKAKKRNGKIREYKRSQTIRNKLQTTSTSLENHSQRSSEVVAKNTSYRNLNNPQIITRYSKKKSSFVRMSKKSLPRLSENGTQRKRKNEETQRNGYKTKKSVISLPNNSQRKKSVNWQSENPQSNSPRKSKINSQIKEPSHRKLYISLTRLSKINSQRKSNTNLNLESNLNHSQSDGAQTRKRSLRVLLTSPKNKAKTPKLIRKKSVLLTPPKKSFVTLRRHEPIRNVKKIDVVSSSRKSKIKKELCVNVTDEILSEKEVSYSHSSFDFSSSSSTSRIQDKTEELKQEKEVVLGKVSSVLTVDLKDFDTFMRSYYRDDETEIRKEEKKGTQSLIYVSDDSRLETKTEGVPQMPSTSESEMNPQTTNNRSLQFLITPRKSSNMSQRTGCSKIIILSDIKLGQNTEPISIHKTLENIWHDHSYTNSPKQKQTSPDLVQNESGLSDIINSSIVPELESRNIGRKVQKPIKLKAGKSYRRSLSLLKRSSVIVDVKNSACHKDCICLKCLFRGKINPDMSRKSSHIVPVSKKSLNCSLLENYARSSIGYVRQEEDYNGDLDESVRSLSLNARSSSILEKNLEVVTAKEVVLRRCGQAKVLPFEECYPRSALQNCQKIGEGVYGEVFLYRNPSAVIGGTITPTTVMKIIPIEGDLIVNGERQKKYDEILSEIVITMELSNLRNNKKNNTTNFAEVQKVRCVQGSYPDRLLDLWELYDETRGSENDSPQIFPPNQTYIILELTNGGKDLESYMFNNAQQAFAMFKQTALALAVAENELKFEHRDLHWGNVLINGVDKGKVVRFRLEGKEIEVDSCGVEVSIIDFTLSRIEFDGVVIFNDLSRDDELFVAQGDYQFEIYRLMQKSNGNEWQHFEPYTNILWLHYLLDKGLFLRYKSPRTKIHKEYLAKLQTLKEQVLSFNSVVDFVKDKFI